MQSSERILFSERGNLFNTVIKTANDCRDILNLH